MKVTPLNRKLALVGVAALSVVALQKPAQADQFNVDFSNLQAGQNVEGLGTVHELLDIDAIYGDGIAIVEGQGHGAYGAWEQSTRRHSIRNGGMAQGGLADKSRHNAFSFSFAPDVTVSEFSLEVLDYGDWNPHNATKHGAYLRAFDAVGNLIDQYSIEHQTGAAQDDVANNVFSGRTVGLQGDAFVADGSTPFGRTLMSVSGADIARVEVSFDNNSTARAGMSSDPNLAFGALSFTADVASEKVPEPTAMLGLLAVGALGAARKRKQNG